MTKTVDVVGNALLRMKNSSIDAQAVEVIGTMQSLGWTSPADLAARDKATADAALDRATGIVIEKQITILQLPTDSPLEQVNLLLDENNLEIQDAILALKSTPQSQRDAMAKISSEEKRLELE